MDDIFPHGLFDEPQPWFVEFLNGNPVVNGVCPAARSSLRVTDNMELIVDVSFSRDLEKSKKVSLCSNVVNTAAFYCKDCCKIDAPIYICQSCFQNGHIGCRNTNVVNLPKQMFNRLKCHCGDFNLMYRTTFCTSHYPSKFNKQNIINSLQSQKQLKQHIVDCFRIYIQVLHLSRTQDLPQILDYCQDYIGQLSLSILDLLVEDPTSRTAIMEGLLIPIMTPRNYQKQILMKILWKERIASENFDLLLGLIIRNSKDMHFNCKILGWLLTRLSECWEQIFTTNNLITNPDKEQQESYLQEKLKIFASSMTSWSIIRQLMQASQFPASKSINKKPYRQSIMKIYSNISRYYINATFSANTGVNYLKNDTQLAICIRFLAKSSLVSIDFIQPTCLAHFMLCTLADEQTFIGLIQQVERACAKKERNQDIVSSLCQVVYIASEGKFEIIDKYLNSQKCKKILSQIIKMEQSNKPGYINKQNVDYGCKIASILNGSIMLQSGNDQKQESIIMTEGNLEINQQQPEQEISNKLNQLKHLQKEQEKKQQKQNPKSKQQKLREAKRTKLLEKYSKGNQKFLIPQRLQKLKSNQLMCLICRQPDKEEKQLFILGHLYGRRAQLSKMLQIPSVACPHWRLSMCKHTFHVECLLIATKNNSNLSQRCPLCRQASNIGFLPPQSPMSEKGHIEYIQLINLSKQMANWSVTDNVTKAVLIVVAHRYEEAVLGSGKVAAPSKNDAELIDIMLNTYKQLYKRQPATEKKKVYDSLNKICMELNKNQQRSQQAISSLYQVLTIATIAEITSVKAQHIQYINKQLQILDTLVSREQIERTIGILPRQMRDELQQYKTSQYNQQSICKGTHNNKAQGQGKEQQTERRFLDYLFKYSITETLSQYYNQFKPVCHKYRTHYTQYRQCLLCSVLQCPKCLTQKQSHHHTSMHKDYCVYVVLKTGEVQLQIHGNTTTKVVYQNVGAQGKLMTLNREALMDVFYENLSKLKLKTQ